MTQQCQNHLSDGRTSWQCDRDAGDKTGRYDQPNCNICAAAYQRGKARTKATIARWHKQSDERAARDAERQRKIDAYPVLVRQRNRLLALVRLERDRLFTPIGHCLPCGGSRGHHIDDCRAELLDQVVRETDAEIEEMDG